MSKEKELEDLLTPEKENYFDVKAISNSSMGRYENNFIEFKNWWVHNIPFPKKESKSLTMGSVIDLLLTSQEGGDNINLHDYYTIIDKSKIDTPSGQMLTYLTELNRNGGNRDEAYQVLVNESDTGKIRSKLPYFQEKEKDFEKYIELLNSPKPILDKGFLSTINIKYEKLKTDKFLSPLIHMKTNDFTDVYHQVEIYSTLNDVPVKGALDKVVVNHKNETILIIDYKTTYNSYEFEYEAIKYKYFRQGSFYLELIQHWMVKKGLQKYTILPFVFGVISTTLEDNGNFVYKLSKNDVNLARYGGTNKYGRYIKGWQEILDEISFLDNDESNWTHPYDIIINKGIIESSMFL